ncbi:GNAT family N-acetyltransferase [Actinoallomurus sp. NPDC050550]|uniref:GNAT family N-acetyltransferase n=1 Tax=Actinoallomurus sp. NPDC050550 TaxID=3154937 RepID=UPI0033DCAE5C
MIVFSRTDDVLGEFAVRPVDPADDAALLHAWVTHPKSVFWMMGDASPSDVVSEFEAIVARPGHDAYLGLHEGRPAFLVERYDPRRELGEVYDVRPGDVGMHFLAAPTDTPIHGFTRAVIVTVMELLFAEPGTRRVVVEPDVRNTAVHALNAAVGFEVVGTVSLPDKQALLSVCTRERYEATRDRRSYGTTRSRREPYEATRNITISGGDDRHDAVAHLTPGRWAHANRLLVRKALAEFAHERLLVPERLPDGRYAVRSDDGTVDYSFAARVLALDHWDIDAHSIARWRSGAKLRLDALDFVVELRHTLGLTEEVLPVYLEEIGSTLASSAYKLARPPVRAADLARADFQAVETGMTEGHPCFVANNGRLGFDAEEYQRYAPEAARPVRLLWLAARRDRSTFTSGAGLDHDALMRAELGAAALERFSATMAGLGLDLADYHLIPVHPWQWRNRLSVTFAGEVARRRLVLLGPSEDEYLAQQSIRTFFNVGAPSKHYVKTALSVLNMGFLRGLSAEYMAATPAINDWVAGLVANDEVLKRTGLTVLRERAAVGYHHEQYAAASAKGSPYLKMLAALWRESPVPLLGPGERVATMASLLHVDRAGDSVAGALINGSGLDPVAWLRRYLDAYLTPILHCFYAHDLVFMPHGENVVLVLDERGVPQRAMFKDIAEEIGVMSADRPLPPEIERVRADVPEDMKILSIFTDVFDCFFRFLSAILDADGTLDEDTFWSTVAACVADYQDSLPHLADRFARYDLFAERFALSCLNRLQLRNNRQMVDLADPAGALQLVGTLENPIARFARQGLGRAEASGRRKRS